MPRAPLSGQFGCKPLLTVKQVCDRTQLSMSTIRRAIKRSDLPHHVLGRSIRVSEADLQIFLYRTHSNLSRKPATY
jgi:excisionase family DNA binding protein